MSNQCRADEYHEDDDSESCEESGEDEVVDPHDLDVLLGKDKYCFNHVGNFCFRLVVNLGLQAYAKATNRRRKSDIIRYIVTAIVQSGGRFIRSSEKDSNVWKAVDFKHAREKVGHAIRDALQTRTRQQKASTTRPPHAFATSSTINDLAYRFNWAELCGKEREKRQVASEQKSRGKCQQPSNIMSMDDIDIFTMISQEQARGLIDSIGPNSPFSHKRRSFPDDGMYPNKMPKRVSTDLSPAAFACETSWTPKNGAPILFTLPRGDPIPSAPQLSQEPKETISPKSSSLLRLITSDAENAALDALEGVNAEAQPHSVTSSEGDDDDESYPNSPRTKEHAFSDVFTCVQDHIPSSEEFIEDFHGVLREDAASLSRNPSRDSLLLGDVDRGISPLPFDHHHHYHHDDLPHHNDVPLWERVATELESFDTP